MASPLATAFVLIRPDTSKFGPELKKGVETAGTATQKAADKHGRVFGTTYVKAAAGPFRSMAGIFSASLGPLSVGLAAIGGVKVFSGFISDARESQKIANLTAAAIKSTGGAANITAGQVGALATALSNKTGKDDEAIQAGQNMLLTFTGIRNEVGKGNDIFNQSSSILTDMTAALHGGEVTQEGMRTQAIQLGKALNDPVKGMTALRRVGVSFTGDQEKQIKALVKSGDTLGAQKIILGELNKEFGGAAKASSSSTDRMGVAIGNLGEKLGGYLLPFIDKVATILVDSLIPAMEDMVKWVSENKEVFIALGIGIAAVVVPAFISWAVAAGAAAVATIAATWPLIAIGAAIAAAAFLIIKNWDTIKKVAATVWKAVLGFITGVWDWIKTHWPLLLGILTGPIGIAAYLITKNWDKIVAGVKSMVGKIKDFFTRLPGQIRAWIGNAALTLLGKGKDLIVGLLNGISRAMATINKWIYDHIHKPILNTFNKAKDWLYNHGGNIIAGLLSGISAKIAGIGQWIRSHVVDPIIGAVKRFFGIKSPSTVMQPLGKNIALGLIKGIIAVNPVRVVSKIFGSMPGALAGLVNKGIVSLSSLPGKALRALTGFIGNLFPSGGVNASVKIGQQLAAARGWVGDQWTALFRLWQGESGWNPLAKNPTSSAFGIPQFLASTARGYGVYGSTDPVAQIMAGMRYIADRYRSPANAFTAWLSRHPHWYDSGGLLPPGVTLAVNNTGRPERVLSPAQSKALDQGGRTYIINQTLTTGVHPAEVGRQTVLAIQAFERGNGSRWRA